ncbi:PREDICTED: vertebrate ancient opsin-like [Tinamus guttatus]|uniref:vertebrate ancient opsin-like n=1 Tax=Tinamus guttatus TaxID=94827 RepID=UPI00052F31E3|nr:PREDICTED: vertebrate ancient opsin-like [Tinamus guttatus]
MCPSSMQDVAVGCHIPARRPVTALVLDQVNPQKRQDAHGWAQAGWDVCAAAGREGAAAPARVAVEENGADLFHQPLASVQPWHFRLLAAVMLVVTALSLVENLAVILVTSRFKQLRQPINYMIVNLSVADFLVSLTGGTISFLANLRGYFYMGHWTCVLEGFAVTFFGLAALWSLALLAVERSFVVCLPPGSTCLAGKHMALGIAFVWSFSFIWTILPTMGYHCYTSYSTNKITSCTPEFTARDHASLYLMHLSIFKEVIAFYSINLASVSLNS